MPTDIAHYEWTEDLRTHDFWDEDAVKICSQTCCNVLNDILRMHLPNIIQQNH